MERTGRYRDQPALNFSLLETDADVAVLEHYWNAQIGMRSDLAEDALIWHIYSSTGLGVRDRFSYYCQRLLKGRSRYLQT